MIRKSIVWFIMMFAFADAGNWDVGGKVSVVQSDGTARLKVVALAEYQIAAMLSWRSDLEMTFMGLGESGDFDLSIPSNVLWYPLSHKLVVDPYTGPGIVLTRTAGSDFFFGLNALVGCNFRIVKGNTFGIEAKYTVVDISNWGNSDNFEFGLTGSWEIEF